MSDTRVPAARLGSPASMLFWLLLLVGAYFVPRGLQSNPDSHLALTYALVEHQTVRIDPYASNLLDKAVYCGRATTTSTCRHYYTDKAPGLSLLATVPYAVLHLAIPPPADPKADRFLLRLLLTLLTLTLPCAAFVASYWRFLAGFVGQAPALLVAIGYAFGSMALPFSMLLFSHALAAALLFWAFMILFHAVRLTRSPWRHVLGAGMLAGYAITCEYPTAIITLLLGVYVLCGSGRGGAEVQRAGVYALGVVLGLLPLVAYNLAAFGALLTPGYAHLTDSYYAHGMAHGLLGIGLPSWQSLWGTTFSPYRGLFLLSPWLLLAVPGLSGMARAGWRREAWLCATISVAYFLFQSGYVFWDGGASVGPRHFLPALPFLAFPVAFALSVPALRRLAVALVAFSVLEIGMVVSTNPLFGDPHYVPNVGNPFVDQTLHDILTGHMQNNWGMLFHLPGATSLLPLLVGVVLLVRRTGWTSGLTLRRYGTDDGLEVLPTAGGSRGTEA